MTSEKKKRSDDEILADILDEAEAEEALEKVTSMTREEREKQLADAGFDMAEEDAHVRAVIQKHRGTGGAPAKVVELPKRGRPFRFTQALLLAAAFALGIGGTSAVGVACHEVFPDRNVAAPQRRCIPPDDRVALEGTLKRTTTDPPGFALDLTVPLCGRDAKSDDHTETLDVPPGGADLPPLVGRQVRVEGAAHLTARRVVPVEP